MNKEKYKKSGFTLVELLVVVVIIAILATIGLVL
ncbi:prepilin-type N-terminal cleavage/methylation domain-containing protein [Candidatus Daviesbacteria bacterium]|nr:prepilin-type N-terminal cleavage/methylation domain-containing protein [Candidatus Daviesbacteria bacterium]